MSREEQDAYFRRTLGWLEERHGKENILSAVIHRDDARNAALGWDIHYLEQEWRSWIGENEIVPKHPERHFVKFCQSWFEKRGRP